MTDFHITGTLVWYAAICERETWLMAHQIEPERDNELLALGRLNQEQHYKRATKELELPGIRVDQIRRENGELILSEIKKSSKYTHAATLQLGYYLYTLEQEGVSARGEVLIPKEKKKIPVQLEDIRTELLETLKRIETLCQQAKPPPATWLHWCDKCAYAEFCWSGVEE
jgi:CRISPR-associated exonuclease Cas4